MIISIPKERKTLEKRVALTPKGAKKLIDAGHTVVIEQGAGEGSFYRDEQYLEAGCQIAKSLAEVWEEADLLVKVKEPAPEEYSYLREDLLLFDYLHLAGLPDVAEELIRAKTTSIAYELVRTDDGRLPLLEPMSEVAGKLAVQNGANFLLTQNQGRGVLLGGTRNVNCGTVTIIGAGIAGQAALKVAYGMGAKVNLLDINTQKLESIQQQYEERLQIYPSNSQIISDLCPETDLMILAVLIPGAKAPKALTTEHIKSMPEGSVLIDISIDQGGAAETIKATTLSEPTFVFENVIHYGVQNMPAQVARTSTEALTAATLPYIQELANSGFEHAIKNNSALKNAVNTYKGNICNQEVANALGVKYTSLNI